MSGFVRNGVITPRGVLRVGDKMIYEGVEETITRVVFADLLIYFESGKKYKK